jgi:hypothetical protein
MKPCLVRVQLRTTTGVPRRSGRWRLPQRKIERSDSGVWSGGRICPVHLGCAAEVYWILNQFQILA